jgi:hypothetical protein
MRIKHPRLERGAARTLTEAEEREWQTVKHEPLTREDWLDLYNTIEDFKRRRIARAMEARAKT